MVDFMANMTRWAVPIDQQMDQLMQQQINENREKMKSIIRRDDNPDDASLQGIFQALLQSRIDSGDTKLKKSTSRESSKKCSVPFQDDPVAELIWFSTI